MSDKPTIVNDEKELQASRTDEPPVVARMIVEIRSDGSRTIARGAMEDITNGQKVAIEARGDSPLQLAYSLAKMISSAPMLARTAAKALRPAADRPKRPSRRSRARRLLRRIRGGGDRS